MKKRVMLALFTMIFMLFSISSAWAAGPVAPGSRAAVPGGASLDIADKVDEGDVTFQEYFDQMFDQYTVKVTPQDFKAMEKLYNDIMKLEDSEEYIKAYDKWVELNSMLNEVWDTAVYNYPSFEEYMDGWLPEDIPANELASIEDLYNTAVALETEKGWEAASDAWDAFYSALDPYMFSDEMYADEEDSFDYTDMTFEEYMDGWLPEDITDEDLASLEELYNEAVALEKEGKTDEASEVWAEFDDILSSYDSDYLESDKEYSYPSFEDFYGEDYLQDLGLTDAERAEMKSLYDEAVALEESGDYEAASVKWEALWAMEEDHYDYYYANYDYPTFDEFLADYPYEFSPKALTQMEQVYNEAIEIQKTGDWEAANDKWNALYYIIDKFYVPGEDDCYV